MLCVAPPDDEAFLYREKSYIKPTVINLRYLVEAALEPSYSAEKNRMYDRFLQCFDQFVMAFGIQLGRIDDIFKTPYRVRNQMITCRLINAKFPDYKYSLKVLKDGDRKSVV